MDWHTWFNTIISLGAGIGSAYAIIAKSRADVKISVAKGEADTKITVAKATVEHDNLKRDSIIAGFKQLVVELREDQHRGAEERNARIELLECRLNEKDKDHQECMQRYAEALGELRAMTLRLGLKEQTS